VACQVLKHLNIVNTIQAFFFVITITKLRYAALTLMYIENVFHVFTKNESDKELNRIRFCCFITELP